MVADIDVLGAAVILGFFGQRDGTSVIDKEDNGKTAG
jgi:hypothetical protein